MFQLSDTFMVRRFKSPTRFDVFLPCRAWTVASDLLGRLAKSGVDPLRNASVREALKRLVKDALEGLSSRYPKPITASLFPFPFRNHAAFFCFVLRFVS